jgi:hypothetical protein
LSWGLARTIAPVFGGFLNDGLAPIAIWAGGLTVGLISTLGLVVLARLAGERSPRPTQPAPGPV